MLGQGSSAAVGLCLFGYRACLGAGVVKPFEVTFEVGIIDLGEIAAFERIGPCFDLGAEGFELDSVLYRHGQRRRRGTCGPPRGR